MVGNVKTGAIDATGQYVLGTAGGGRVSSWSVHFDGTFSGTVIIKGKSAAANAEAYALVNLGYKDFATGANSTSNITAAGAVLVDSSGLNVVLDCTAYTSGTLNYVATPVIG